MRFSRRLPESLVPHALWRLRQRSRGCIDLMQTRPAALGLAPALPATPLQLDVGPPDPCGTASLRQALASYLGAHGHPLQATQLVCTASTSEAYAWVLKLLCDPGDKVAMGVPAYPLLQQLLSLEALQPLMYRWEYARRWRLDLDSVAAAL